MAADELHAWLAFDVERARKVVTAFLGEYVRRTGVRGVTVGLSGGLDSAVVAALSVDAFEHGNVDVAFLPGTTTSREDRELATEVARHLGLSLAEVLVGPAVEALAPRLGVEAERAIVGNVQARLRMAVLYARAQGKGNLVAGTSNKSELLTGYFTKHGDGGADVLPIGDLYKSQVRVLGRALALPRRVLDRAPTAGLWQGQTDEAELGLPYAKLDVVLAGIERQAPPDAIAREASVARGDVDRITGLVRRTWHKRNPPPVPKLGWRTVGVDWRESTS